MHRQSADVRTNPNRSLPNVFFTVLRAFSLIEMMLVLALIAIISTIIVSTADGLLAGDRKDSPYEVLRKAVDAAWYAAATRHRQMSLDYDAEARALVLRPGTSTLGPASSQITWDVTADEDDGEVQASDDGTRVFAFNDERVATVRFMSTPNDDGGSLQTTRVLSFSRIVFSPWGGSTPAVVEMDIKGETYRYRLDVFGGGLEVFK